VKTVATELAEHILDLEVWSDGSREALMCRDVFFFFSLKKEMKIMVQGQDLLYIREYLQLRKNFLVPGCHINFDGWAG